MREGQLQCFLRKLKNNQFFTKEVYDKIYPSGSKPASIYGLPKIHKLKLVATKFYFSPNESPSKTTKNAFYFI